MSKAAKQEERSHKITFQPMGIRGRALYGKTIMAVAADHSVNVRSDCGGQGLCGKCLVKIFPSDHASPPSDNEIRLLSPECIIKGGRLACETEIRGDTSVSVSESALDSREAIGKTLGGTVPAENRKNIQSSESKGTSLGIAMDLGTTTLALYLCDLRSATILTTISEANPQRRYGEDVISRIAYTNENSDGVEVLNGLLVEVINAMINQSLINTGHNRNEIEKITVVGNTTMQHLFVGLHPGKLGTLPYMPESCQSQIHQAGDLRLSVNRKCLVYVFPVISGFVGGDTVAVILSEAPYRKNEIFLILDIGTNGEIVLGNRESIWVTSCATGPALEGAHIECGMRASSGAIEKIFIDPVSYQVDYTMIGDDSTMQPRGLCGSAIVDAVAEMLKAGLISPSGRLCEGLPGIVADEKGIGREFVIVRGDNGKKPAPVVLTLSDIRQVQLAKSALSTGIKLLMKHSGIDRFDRVVLTGAFGARFNWRNAVDMGMLPDCVYQTDVALVENCAGRGAVLALLDESLRDEIEKVARGAHLLELANDPEFTMEFAFQTTFPQVFGSKAL